MKRLAMAVALACVMTVSVAQAQELVGTWDMKMDYQGSVIDSKMNITKADDGALKGTWAGRLGETELSDLKLEGNTITFTRTIQVQGQEFDIAFTGTIEGDAITGAYETAMGTMNVTGARQGAVAAAAALGDVTLLVGDWLADVSSGLGDFQHTLIFKGDGTGIYDAGDVKYDLTNVALAGADVTFDMTIDIEGQKLPLKFQGKLEGDALNGELVSEMGNGTVKAKRAGAAPAIVGTWDVTSESQLGTLKRTLIVNPDLSGTYKTDAAEFAISDLKHDGSNVGFNVTVDVQGQQLPLTFAGMIDGSVLKGEFKSEGGNATVTATKVGGAVAAGGVDADLRAMVEKFVGELKAQNIDGMMAYYAEDFKYDQGGGKAELAQFLKDAKDQGMLADIGAKLENLKIALDGTKAKVQNIELEGAFGVLTVELDVEQRDGAWLIVYQTQY